MANRNQGFTSSTHLRYLILSNKMSKWHSKMANKTKSENQFKPVFFPISELNQSNHSSILSNLSQNWMGSKPNWIPLPPPPPSSGLEKICDSAALELLLLLLPHSALGLCCSFPLSQPHVPHYIEIPKSFCFCAKYIFSGAHSWKPVTPFGH